MKTSQMTSKGQITVPANLRQQLGLHSGDQVGFGYEDGKVFIFPVSQDISTAFGVVKADSTVSIEEMELSIQARGAGS